jgi:hypothetical protein
MRLRIGNSTITYRGTLRVTEQDGGDLAVEGEGNEARGGGKVKLAMLIRLTPRDGGTTMACSATVRSEGRLAEAGPTAAQTAARRLLDRFAAELSAGLDTVSPTVEDDNKPVIPNIPSPESEPRPASRPEAEPRPEPESEPGVESEAERAAEAESAAAPEPEAEPEGASLPQPSPEPLAEAAHARRTMIGRSAEEVDHAPPRGRYAPVPAPAPVSASATLRWAAPAAALVFASAVVIGRMLRRRRC